MFKLNFEGLKSATGGTVMFSVFGNSTKELFDAANLYAAQRGIHNIACYGTENLRTDWEQTFGKTDPEHHFLDDDQEIPDANDQEGRKDQAIDAQDVQQEEG